MAKTDTTHSHRYDLLPPNPNFLTTRVACTICGFSVPLHMLESRTNLDAITARKNATQAVRDRLDGIDGRPEFEAASRRGRHVMSRCLCGLLVRYHRDRHNRSLSCAEARLRHPRASVRRRSFRSLLAMSVKPREGAMKFSDLPVGSHYRILSIFVDRALPTVRVKVSETHYQLFAWRRQEACR